MPVILFSYSLLAQRARPKASICVSKLIAIRFSLSEMSGSHVTYFSPGQLILILIAVAIRA